jgi:hypothetical protein
MSRVLMSRVFAKDTFKVAADVVATGWKPGQFFYLNTAGEARLATGDNALFMGVDPSDRLSTPPTGSVLTGVYGIGSKVYINHANEKAAVDNVYAFNTDVLGASIGDNLWVDGSGKLTVTGSLAGTGSVIAKVIQVPAASNDYTLGVIFRI